MYICLCKGMHAGGACMFMCVCMCMWVVHVLYGGICVCVCVCVRERECMNVCMDQRMGCCWISSPVAITLYLIF